MDKPNPGQTWQQFWEERDNQLALFGVAYVWTMRNTHDYPTFLYVLRTVDVVLINDPKSSTYGALVTQQDGRRVFIPSTDIMSTRKPTNGEGQGGGDGRRGQG